jgi:uncharacterized protein involved in high-affinity Fe2+ transport
MEPSEEVDEKQLQLAREAGDVYLEAVEYMLSEVAETGAKTEANQYVVGIAQEKAEGMYHMEENRFKWKEPDEENCHLEVVVADADDGRFLPHLNVEATIEHEDGTQIGPAGIPFVWHPGLYHYGRNFETPGDGTYTVTVDVEPASFPRHDETNGDRYTEPVSVEFEDVEFTTGQS